MKKIILALICFGSLAGCAPETPEESARRQAEDQQRKFDTINAWKVTGEVWVLHWNGNNQSALPDEVWLAYLRKFIEEKNKKVLNLNIIRADGRYNITEATVVFDNANGDKKKRYVLVEEEVSQEQLTDQKEVVK